MSEVSEEEAVSEVSEEETVSEVSKEVAVTDCGTVYCGNAATCSSDYYRVTVLT